MTDELLTYKRFATAAEARELANFLNTKGIAAEVEDASPTFDITFSGNEFQNQFNVKIPKQHFTKANTLLEQHFSTDLASIPADYYLFSFSDDELFDILTNPDEWSPLDHNLARQMLAARGKQVDEQVIQALKRRRIRELAKPEEPQHYWIAAGYLLALLGGLMAVFIGWYLMSHKKTLPNGERTYAFLPKDRDHGFYILLLGSFMFLLSLFLHFIDVHRF